MALEDTRRIPIKGSAQAVVDTGISQLEAELARRAKEMKEYEKEQ